MKDKEPKTLQVAADTAPTVIGIFRYPVSSTSGESMKATRLERSGVPQDRAWGIFNTETSENAAPGRENRWKDIPQAFSRITPSGAVEVSIDAKTWIDGLSPSARQALSLQFGFPAEVRVYEGANPEGPRPRYQRSAIHLLSTASLRSLRKALPDSLIDERRFRPNILVDIPDCSEPIPEYAWMGKEFRIGGAILRGTVPCARCGFTTLEQNDLPLDVEVLRTLVKQYHRNFGIYCDVVEPGDIRRGDAVTVLG